MPNRCKRIHALTDAIINFLKERRNESIGVSLVLERLNGMNLGIDHIVDATPVGTRHEGILDQSINEMSDPALKEIATCLTKAKEYLVWREDNNNYYQHGANVGQGYRKCNLHTVLIGPDACGYKHHDFILGFFLLGPKILYRDHCHAAPELYLNLSDRTGWRLKSQDWQDYPAGSFIWNEAKDVHATRVYDQPFLSIFIWLENIEGPCIMVPVDGWDTIETELKNLSDV